MIANSHKAARCGRPLGRRRSAAPRFTARRVELGLTLRAIASALSASGQPTSLNAVHAWERGNAKPSEGRIAPLAHLLRVPVDQLYTDFGLDFCDAQQGARERKPERRPVAQGARG